MELGTNAVPDRQINLELVKIVLEIIADLEKHTDLFIQSNPRSIIKAIEEALKASKRVNPKNVSLEVIGVILYCKEHYRQLLANKREAIKSLTEEDTQPVEVLIEA